MASMANTYRVFGPELSPARSELVAALTKRAQYVPTPSRAAAAAFAKKMLETANVCTKENVKFCSAFIIKFVFGSCGLNPRINALSVFLVSVSKSFRPTESINYTDTTYSQDHNLGLEDESTNGVPEYDPPEPAVKRLHLLYVLHDALIKLWLHDNDLDLHKAHDKALLQFWPAFCALADLAACHGGSQYAKTADRVRAVVNVWGEAKLFTEEQIGYMRDRISQAEKSEFDALAKKVSARGGVVHTAFRAERDEFHKWMFPDRHGTVGNEDAPWHELPAANGLLMRRTGQLMGDLDGCPLRKAGFPKGGFHTSLDYWDDNPPDPYNKPHVLNDKPGMWANPVHGQAGVPGNFPEEHMKVEANDLYNDVMRCFDKYTPLDEVEDVDAMGNVIWKDKKRPVKNYWGWSIDGFDKRKKVAKSFDPEFRQQGRREETIKGGGWMKMWIDKGKFPPIEGVYPLPSKK